MKEGNFLENIRSILLWGVGLLHFFIVFLLIGSGLLLFPAPKIYPLARLLARSQLRIMGVRLHVTGLNNFDHQRPFLIMGNHESVFDVFAMPAAIPMFWVGVEASYHFAMPLWGWLIKRWGNIPINRANITTAKASLDRAGQVIRSGVSIGILPEGHRTLTGELGEFKKGPFHLAHAAQADILPFVIKGLFHYNKKGSRILRPTTAYINFGQPLPYTSFKNSSVEVIRERVRETILDLKHD
ncbi:lysophospholipid acyltransferase family protein [Desulfococcaceae bacterium HSG9]|nr:lysophospholipid acyltransferase family protein [Desulfococcaceae bacterium HSG9]